MKVLMLVVLGIAFAGCGGGRDAAPGACDALATCCATGLPGNTGTNCANLVNAGDDAGCDAGLQALHQASYCTDIAAGPPADDDSGCARYLSCLLAAEPEAYGAAVQLYGDGSACWANAQQTAGCNQACDASYAKIASSCTCEGSSCTKCAAPAAGAYHQSSPAGGSTCAGGGVLIESAQLTVTGGAGIFDLHFESPEGSGEVKLAGVLACNGPSMLMGGGVDQFGCTTTVTATLAQQGATLVLAGTWITSCPSGPSESCTQTITLVE